MNIADRIQYLRKQKGYSQEELADKVGVSRQAVSKWESEQSTPDLEKVIVMSELFEVTTDYMYCEKCKKLISQSICPICGNKNIRIPEERDICFLVEKDHIWSGMLEDVLKQNNIPVFVQAGALFERIRFYVPFLYLEAANTIVNELFSADEYAENKE